MTMKKSPTPAIEKAVARSVNFELTIADQARRSERRAWWVAFSAVGMSLILAGGYFYMLPLKQKVPYLVMADAYTGTATVAHLTGNFGPNGITTSEAINRSNVAHFVLARESYDLVLMDCQMPIMDGFEAAREIRRRNILARSGKPLPIVALTASAIRGDHERCEAAGMTGYLTKPLDPKAVIHTIRTITTPSFAAALPDEDPPLDLAELRDRCLGNDELVQQVLAIVTQRLPRSRIEQLLFDRCMRSQHGAHLFGQSLLLLVRTIVLGQFLVLIEDRFRTFVIVDE